MAIIVSQQDTRTPQAPRSGFLGLGTTDIWDQVILCGGRLSCAPYNVSQWGLPHWSSGQDSASNAGGTGSISGQGIKTSHAAGCRQKKETVFSNIPGFYSLDPLGVAMPFRSSYNSQNCFQTFPNVPHGESHPQVRNLPELISQTHHNRKFYLLYKPSFGSQQRSWMKDIVCGICPDYSISVPPSYAFRDVGLKPSQYCKVIIL